MKRLLLFSAFVVASVLNVFACDFSAVSPSGHRLCYDTVNGNAVLSRQSNLMTGVLVIPDTVSNEGITYQVVGIGIDAFNSCGGLTAIIIPNTVTTIGDYAFRSCGGLTSMTIPNSVISIGLYAFHGCQHLDSVTIPNSVTSIGHYAFQDCIALTSITIPSSVTSIGLAICEGCTSLNSITVDAGNTHYDSRNNCNAIIETATNKLISGCQSTVIPNTVTCLGRTAFAEMRNITSMPIPNSVTTIEYGVFWSCSGLTSVNIPNSVVSIGEGAFCQCRIITSVTIPNSVVSIGNRAFCNCNLLNTVNFNADSCVVMGNSYFPVFMGCPRLTTLNIGTNVKLIPAYAFYGCDSLSNPLVIPNSVRNIGNMAFYGCRSLPSATIGNSVTSIGNYAFQYCTGLNSVTIGDAVTCIGEGAFYSCSGMNSLTIGSSVDSIGGYAFYGCSGLDSIIIPNSVNTIGDYAFAGCSGLTSVIIGDSVSSIGDGAFQNCTGLTSVTIPSSVTSIGGAAFLYCIGLTEITSMAAVPPTLGLDAFVDVPTTIPVYIPCGSMESYRTNWPYFTNFIEIYSHSLTVQSADETMGTVAITIQPTACSDSIAEVTATANIGYRFDHWSDGSTSNPYTFTVTSDTTIIAYFVSEGGTDGIEEVNDEDIRIYAQNGRIVVTGAETENVQVFDMMGRPLHTDHHPLPTGVYMVKVGTLPVRKVVVVR